MMDYDDLARKLERLPRDYYNAELYNDIGVLLYRIGDYPNAQKYLALAWALSPATPCILFNYALAVYACCNFAKAAELLAEYLTLDATNKEVIEKAADTAYQLGDYQSAATYQKSLSGLGSGI